MRIIAVLSCLLMSTSAYAGAKDMAPKLLDAEVKAIAASDAPAFAAMFDANAYLILPTASGEARGKAAIAAAAKTWFAALGKVPVKAEKVRAGGAYQADGGFFYAELVAGSGATAKRYRISGVVAVGDTYDPGKGDTVDADYRVQAVLISEAVDDKVALAAAAAGKLPALPTLKAVQDAGEEHDVTDEQRPDHIATYARHVSEVDGAILVGSAPGEVVFPRSKIMAKLKGWKGLKLATTGAIRRVDRYAMGGFQWVVGHVTITFTVKGKPVVVPYRVLVVYEEPPAAADAATELLAAHFSVAME